MEDHSKKVVGKKRRLRLIVLIVVWALALVLVVLALFGQQLFGGDSVFAQVFQDPKGGFAMVGAWIVDQLPVIIRSLIGMIVVLAIFRLIRFIISKLMLVTKKGKTASKLLDSFFRYLTAIVVIIVVLLIFGVDPVALFASVGVLSLIVGLGAQSLISDIISGLFIVFEDEYEVGDIVVIDGFRGKVESIGIRTTQIVDAGGNKKVINNSEIVSIVNLSYDNSLISVEVAIPYDSLKQFETVFKENAEALKQQLPALVEGPKYVGPIDFGNDGLSVKIIAKVPEEGRFQAERDMRRAIFLLMETNNIDMPYETYNINASMDSK